MQCAFCQIRSATPRAPTHAPRRMLDPGGGGGSRPGPGSRRRAFSVPLSPLACALRRPRSIFRRGAIRDMFSPYPAPAGAKERYRSKNRAKNQWGPVMGLEGQRLPVRCERPMCCYPSCRCEVPFERGPVERAVPPGAPGEMLQPRECRLYPRCGCDYDGACDEDGANCMPIGVHLAYVPRGAPG